MSNGTLGILDLAHQVFPSYHWARHHHFITGELFKLATGEFDRLILVQPPQTSKSTLTSQIFPAWYLMNFPRANIILLSYEASLAETHSEKAMNIVRQFGWLTGTKLGRKQSIAHWQTSEGGQVVAGSIMGGVTGKPADIVLIDDPLKGDEAANSPTIRAKLLREFEACCETRLSPTGKILITNTRWHMSDLTGQVLNLESQGGKKWKHLCLPALAEENDPLGRLPGESIWQERYPKEFYEDRKRNYELLGQTYQWHALYQGNPTSGNQQVEWPAEHFGPHIWFTEDTRPLTPVKLRVLATDPSKGSDSKNADCQAHCLLDLLEDGTILVESWIQRQTIDVMLETIISLWTKYQPHGVCIESGNGQELYGTMLLQKAKFLSPKAIPLYVFNQKLKKEVRIRMGLSPLFAQHRLKFLRSPSNSILIGQAREFPTSQFDDGLDSLELGCQMLNKLITGSRMPGPLLHTV